MSELPTIEIRARRISGLAYILAGLLFGPILLLTIDRKGQVTVTYWLIRVGIVLGALGAVVYGAYRLFDKTVKLSITLDGMQDHRTGATVRWVDCRDINLEVRKTNGALSGAAMQVVVKEGKSYSAIQFNLYNLDKSPEEIVQLVQSRRFQALERIRGGRE